MGDIESKKNLEIVLGNLLGLDDGETEDLLEHLLTIDSDDDLSEYLNQLLGDQTPEIIDFFEDMSRYRRGEPLAKNAKDDADDDHKKSDTKAAMVSSSQENTALDSFRTMAMANNEKKSKESAGRKNTKKKQIKSRVPPPKSVNTKKSTPASKASSVNGINRNFSSSSTSPSEAQNLALQQSKEQHGNEVVQKSLPSRGKPKVVCGCFGTKYKALTNCLYCGRIICEKEGYDYCPFCGIMVEPPTGGNGEAAFLQKERLLRFDKDFARRTKVFDDQADYQGQSTWMTEEENTEAEENVTKHLESLRRPKQTLNLAM